MPDAPDDYYAIERPKEAARKLGFSMSSFYRRAKDDPDFPPIRHLGPRATGIFKGERIKYAKRLRAK